MARLALPITPGPPDNELLTFVVYHRARVRPTATEGGAETEPSYDDMTPQGIGANLRPAVIGVLQRSGVIVAVTLRRQISQPTP